MYLMMHVKCMYVYKWSFKWSFKYMSCVHTHVCDECVCVFVQFYFCRFISVTSMASIHPACMYNLKVVSWDYILGLGAQYVHFSRIMCVGLMITTAYTPIRFLSCLKHCHPNHHIYHTHPTAWIEQIIPDKPTRPKTLKFRCNRSRHPVAHNLWPTKDL